MTLANFRQAVPSYLDALEAFIANIGHRHRYLLTFRDGAHLIGVPTIRTSEEATNPDATFNVSTAIGAYSIPLKLLAYAQRLIETGLRASDGQPPVPEPCSGPPQRVKHEKFAILDSPHLLADDLSGTGGLFGTSVLYLDIDHFEALNTRYTERVIDRTVLPEFQTLISAAVQGHGFAYAEGGDEVVILLVNTSTSLATNFAEELRRKIAARSFAIGETSGAGITVSIGVASSTSGLARLPGWANLAKAEAKKRGRNRTVATRDGLEFQEIAAAPT
jgi:diguanylate cyclase (GGDEF)-like protein